MVVEPSTLDLAFNHIAFPPNLPGEGDGSETDNVHNYFVTLMLHAVAKISEGVGEDSSSVWLTVENILKTCLLVNQGGFVNKKLLLGVIEGLNPGDASMVFVGQQNACLLIRKPMDEQGAAVFEAFETSPAAGPTLATKGALQWDFPGMAVTFPATEFRSLTFQDNLTSFLEQASLEPIDEFAAKTRKAGVELAEARDTADPAMITRFLMTLLEAKGARINVPVLRKRVRDDVPWDNAEVPWRRSPFWLALRV